MGVNYAPNVVRDGLVLYLDAANKKSYPGSGTTWTDLSGTGNTGTLTNGPTFSSSNNGSVVFDGTNDYVQTLRNDISNNSSFSLSCWFSITTLNSTFRPLIDAGNVGVGNAGYCLAINSSNQLYVAANAGFTSISNALSINTWYFVTATASFGASYSFSLYLNGALGTVASSSSTSALTNNVSWIRIAQNTNGTLFRFPGSMANICVYSRALSASEVLQNFNATRSRYGV